MVMVNEFCIEGQTASVQKMFGDRRKPYKEDGTWVGFLRMDRI